MSEDKNDFRLKRQFDQIERTVPRPIARFINWLRRPGVQLIRVPLGLLLILGGVFSVLPFLGLWMLPLGLLILALDVRLLRGPVTMTILRAQSWWRRRRRTHLARRGEVPPDKRPKDN